MTGFGDLPLYGALDLGFISSVAGDEALLLLLLELLLELLFSSRFFDHRLWSLDFFFGPSTCSLAFVFKESNISETVV